MRGEQYRTPPRKLVLLGIEHGPGRAKNQRGRCALNNVLLLR
jgi:hypothetical protein